MPMHMGWKPSSLAIVSTLNPISRNIEMNFYIFIIWFSCPLGMLETLLDSMFFFGSLSSSIRNYPLSHILVDSRPFLVGLFCGVFFLNVRVSFPLFFSMKWQLENVCPWLHLSILEGEDFSANLDLILLHLRVLIFYGNELGEILFDWYRWRLG